MTDLHDPMADVAAYRPTDERLSELWPAERRAAVLDRARTAPAGRRRWAPAVLVAGLAAAAVAAGISLTSGSTPATAGHAAITGRPAPTAGRPSSPRSGALVLLAARARLAPARATTGYWHVVRRDTQDGRSVVQESWTDGRGRVWRRDTERDGSVDYLLFAPGTGSFDDPTPQTLRHLPTDPAVLTRTLRAHVSGGTSTDEAVFDYVQTIVGSGWASPELRAAALTVLQHTGRVVTSTTTDALGRAAVRADFTDPTYRPGETDSLYFDPQTTELLETRSDLDVTAGRCPPTPPGRSAAPGGGSAPCPAEHEHYTGTFTRQGQVAAVPTVVRAKAVRQHR